DGQRRARERVRDRRGLRRRHARRAPLAAARLHAPDRSGQDRAGHACAGSEGTARARRAPPDLPRKDNLRGAKAALRRVSREPALPQDRGLSEASLREKSTPASRKSVFRRAGGKACQKPCGNAPKKAKTGFVERIAPSPVRLGKPHSINDLERCPIE